MKYDVGSIVLLADGKMAYIMSVDTEQKQYRVAETENTESMDCVIVVSEKDVVSLVT